MNLDVTRYKFIDKLKELGFVDAIWLFGSRARGDSQDRSDIDIAILCPSATRNDWLKVVAIIDEADTLLKIDCLRFEKYLISSDLYANILKDKKVLYERDAAWEKL